MDTRTFGRRHGTLWWAAGIFVVLLLTACAKPVEPTGEACGFGVGEVVVSELMAAPDGGPEWLELHNTTDRPLLLNRAVIEVGGTHLVLQGAGTLAPGDYYVAGNAQASFIDFSYPQNLLSSRGGSLVVSCQGVVSHRLDYGSATTTGVLQKGRSIAHDGAAPFGEATAGPRYWCAGSTRYAGDANRGTPGAANPVCGIAYCRDGEQVRAVEPPHPGEVAVSEVYVYATPEATDPWTQQQWVELRLRGNRHIDLNGLDIANTNMNGSIVNWTLAIPECIRAAPGDFRVIRFLPDSAVPTDGERVQGEALYKDAGRLVLSHDGVLIDSATLPRPVTGASIGLDTERNEFCAARSGPEGARMSPGQENDPCGPACSTADGHWRRLRPPAPGELVISEVYADARGGDAGREWLELYVAAAESLDLNGLLLLNTEPVTGKSHGPWTINSDACLSVAPRSYAVLGGDAVEATGVSARYLIPGLALYNDASSLTLLYTDTVIDNAALPAAVEAVAAGLDRDHLGPGDNDSAGAFCLARSAGAFAETGTPGTVNDPCGAYCLDGGAWRPIAAPGTGDLVISEVHADPAGSDTGREWLELYVSAASSVDLNGIVVSNSVGGNTRGPWPIGDNRCMAAAPGSHVVLAGDKWAETGLAAARLLPGIHLYNDASMISLVGPQGVIDEAALPAAVSGVAANLDRATLTATANDDAAAFCSARTSGIYAERGTPGAANEPCGAFCIDGGVWRAIAPPAAGDLIVTEVYLHSTTDDHKDWFELYMVGGQAADLNGLSITHRNTGSNVRTWSVAGDVACLAVRPGEYAIVGAADAASTGALPRAVATGMDFYASAGSVVLETAGVAVDTASFPKPAAGVAVGLSPANTDTTANDSAANWCAASVALPPFTALGSPGAVNEACP